MRHSASIAIVTVLTVVIGAAGALGAAHAVRPVTHFASGLASPSPSAWPIPTPTEPPPPPVTLPATAQIVAPLNNVVWAFVNYQWLYVSPDQGRNWETRTLPIPFSGRRPVISFVNYREGWLLVPGVPATQCEEAAAELWHTSDGAMTWQQLNVTGIDKSQCKDGIWFVDTKHGFIAADDPNHQPTVYRTSDGGNSWTSAVLPDPPDFKSSAGGFELAVVWLKAFGSTLYLEAADGQADPATSHQYLFTSGDGGSWSWRQKLPPHAPVMVTEARFLLLTGSAGPQESTNGGQQWHPFTTDLKLDSPEFGGTNVVFADAQVGYETGRGLVQRTSDGGAHWVRIQVPGSLPQASPSPAPSGIPMPTTAALSAPSPSVVWALVASSSLFRSVDQGRTWTERPLPYPAGSLGTPLLAFVDATTGFVLLANQGNPACGDQAADLWETTDGAVSWHTVSTTPVSGQPVPRGLPSAQCKDAMYFADAKHGWLATGSPGTPLLIWRTSDGGLTWDSSAPNDPRFAMFTDSDIRVSGFASYGATVLFSVVPYVFRSTDDGQTWSYVTQSPRASTSIGFVTASRWLELISPADSSETTDAGASWHTFTTDYSAAAPIASPHIVFADANVGYATGGGQIQRTLDGGMRWELIKTSWP